MISTIGKSYKFLCYLSDLSFIIGLLKHITYRIREVVWTNGEALNLVTEYMSSSSSCVNLGKFYYSLASLMAQLVKPAMQET